MLTTHRQVIRYGFGEYKMPLKQPLIVPIKGDRYELFVDYRYEWKADKYPLQQLHIPKGFKYDGASVPQIGWSITGIRPDGLNRAAALVHDYIYRYQGKLPRGRHLYQDGASMKFSDHVWTRKEADRLFCRLLCEAGVGKWTSRIMYYAVRSFGWTAWKD